MVPLTCSHATRHSVAALGHPGRVETTSCQPSALIITTDHRSTLEAILDALAPTFAEPGPRVLREDGGTWRRMLLIPSRWCVRECGPIAAEVLEAAAQAYALGAVEVSAVSYELTQRPMRRLTVARSP